MIDKLKINTIYIVSKGRPRCRTAETLISLNYPGAWFIVCGANDDTLPQYQARWGERVLAFDWKSEAESTNLMDNFGLEKESGVAPARNAAAKISFNRGENRFWLLDDDYTGFSIFNPSDGKNETIRSGNRLFDLLYKIAKFGYDANMKNVGFSIEGPESHPLAAYDVSFRVFNAHNLPSSPELFLPFAGRVNEDIVNAVDVWRKGGYEISVKFLHLRMGATQASAGGLTPLYKADGTARKTAYGILAAPSAARLVYRFGRYHHSVAWAKLRPMLLDEKWRRKEGSPPAPQAKAAPNRSALADKWRKALL